MLNFPDAPTTNQVFAGPNGSFQWDGTKWAPYGAGGPSFAPPSASVGLTAIPGVAASAMRSDAAPALSQAIVPTWTGKHAFAAGLTAAALVDAAATFRATANTPPASGVGVELIYTGTTGTVQAYDRGASAYKPISINGSTIGLGGGPVSITDATASSLPTNGALTVAGGIGVGNSITIANTFSYNGTDSAGTGRSLLILDNANPDVVHLRNNQRGVGGTISIESKAGGAPSVTCLANGNVGIGATAPGYTLVVNNGASNPSAIQVTNGTYSGFLTPGGAQDALNMSGGAYYNGTSWIATQTGGACFVGAAGNNFSVQMTGGGQTIGNAVSFVTRANCNPTGGWQAQGTTTNDSPTAGFIGETVTASIASAVPLSTGVLATIATLSLTPGDWEVWCTAAFTGASNTTLSSMTAGLSSITTDFNYAQNSLCGFNLAAFGYANPIAVVVLPTPIKLAATTNIYFLCKAYFGTSTMSVGPGSQGTSIFARRRR